MAQELALKILQDLKNSPNMANHGFAAGFVMRVLYDHFKKAGKNPVLVNEVFSRNNIRMKLGTK